MIKYLLSKYYHQLSFMLLGQMLLTLPIYAQSGAPKVGDIVSVQWNSNIGCPGFYLGGPKIALSKYDTPKNYRIDEITNNSGLCSSLGGVREAIASYLPTFVNYYSNLKYFYFNPADNEWYHSISYKVTEVTEEPTWWPVPPLKVIKVHHARLANDEILTLPF